MPPDAPQSPLPGTIPENPHTQEEIYRLYAGLASTVPLHAETGLGGRLLYAGELAGTGRALLVAANVAGAASLAASANQMIQRAAIRDGVIDFLVNSLEEALRILKNEIRKRQPVSVGVALAPELLVAQMLEIGVLPDLLTPGRGGDEGMTAEAVFVGQGALRVVGVEMDEGGYTTWSVDRDFSRWLRRIDACVSDALPADDLLRRRWLHLAPRYLGRLAQRQHGLALSPAEAEQLRDDAGRLLREHRTDDGGVPVVTIGAGRVN